jgi:hypothetical protein
VLVRDTYRGRDLCRSAREAHRAGPADGDTRVARVQRELEWFGTRPFRADGGAQPGEKWLERLPNELPNEFVVCGVGVRDTRDATD